MTVMISHILILTLTHEVLVTKAPIHRREEYYTYCIKKSDDGNDISHFDIDINSRGFGDPPYEGPEYEKYINVDVE